jgi:threonine/homoserine/homoserine lactone efflux protein
VTATQILSFAAASMVLLIIPGPSILFVVSRGITLGRRAALATVLGNTMGSAVHVTAVAVGVGALVARSATVFTAMKLAGACYLVWLGLRAVRHRTHLVEALTGPATPRSASRLLRDGFVVGISNPKTTLFFLAVLPQFVRTEAGHPSLQLLALGAVFCALALVNDSAYGLAAGSLRRWLDRSPRRLAMVGGTSGLLMIGLGIRLALTGRRD